MRYSASTRATCRRNRGSLARLLATVPGDTNSRNDGGLWSKPSMRTVRPSPPPHRSSSPPTPPVSKPATMVPSGIPAAHFGSPSHATGYPLTYVARLTRSPAVIARTMASTSAMPVFGGASQARGDTGGRGGGVSGGIDVAIGVEVDVATTETVVAVAGALVVALTGGGGVAVDGVTVAVATDGGAPSHPTRSVAASTRGTRCFTRALYRQPPGAG